MRRFASRSSLVAAAALPLAAVLGLATLAGAATQPSSGSSGARRFPGASGSVAAITGSSMEVQSQLSGQVTVSWTTSTSFTQMVSVAASSISVGDCVTVSGSLAKKTKKVTAKTVTVSQPTGGKCTGGFGNFTGGGSRAPSGGGSVRGGTSGGTPPSGGSFPGGGSGRPPGGGSFPGGASRARAGGFAGIGFASGKVTAVTPTSITVSGFSSASLPTSTKRSKQKPTTPKTTTTKVAVTSSTTYSESQSAVASALAVGDCVTAMGTSDSTGAVAASSVRITSTGSKSCTAGFAAFAGRGAASA